MTGDVYSEITSESVLRVLEDLVAIDSVNPMDRPYSGLRAVESEVNDYLESFFAEARIPVERDQFSPRHENLLVRIQGADGVAPTLFETHGDTVPSYDWPDLALKPRRQGGTLIARGAADAKGALAAMMLAIASLVRSEVSPPHSILLLCAGDEEFGQTGVRHFLAGNPSFGRAVVGEPTSLVPIVQHKGAVRWDITVFGRSAHSSRPELGVNAIDGAIEVIEALRNLERDLRGRYATPLMTGPSITVTRISGGRSRNAVPDECTVSVDYRIVPGQSAEDAQSEIIALLEGLPYEVTHAPTQLLTPPLATCTTDPFAQAVLTACCQEQPDVSLAGAPYGTDASWLSQYGPCVVLGPGSIDNAHAVNEFVPVAEVVRCGRIYRAIMLLS